MWNVVNMTGVGNVNIFVLLWLCHGTLMIVSSVQSVALYNDVLCIECICAMCVARFLNSISDRHFLLSRHPLSTVRVMILCRETYVLYNHCTVLYNHCTPLSVTADFINSSSNVLSNNCAQ